MKAVLIAAVCFSPLAAMAASSIDPASEFSPKLVIAAETAKQLQVGPINPSPAALNIPVNYSAYVALHKENGKWTVGTVIGAIGADVWVKPLTGGWSVAQNGWAGGTIDGGAATGTGIGIYYQPGSGIFSNIKFGVCGGVDAVSGQKAGIYAGASAMGTIKF